MRFLMTLSVAMGAAVFAACGDDDNTTSTPTAARISTTAGMPFIVKVGLKDYELVPNPDSGSSGDYEFQVSNNGPSVHEFVIVKTELAADKLPTDSEGAVVEGGALEAIGEIEDIAVGGPQTFTASLEAGQYVLFCNIVEQGGAGTIAHYTQGMHTDFSVQ